ncbi:MAG: RHS repeat-associated core domain-containing protein [Phycisphaerae bacterium]
MTLDRIRLVYGYLAIVLVSALAQAQPRMFIVPQGDDPANYPSGSTEIDVDEADVQAGGFALTLEAYLENTAPTRVRGYQIALDDAIGGSGGTPHAVACETAADCDDSVICTDDNCIDHACINTPNDALCDDGLFCDGRETCDAVLDCQLGTPPNCDDGNPCTVDSCDEVGDICINTESPDGMPCDDGQFCTVEDTCQAGVCIGSGGPCLPEETCDEDGDQCVPGPAAACLPPTVTGGIASRYVQIEPDPGNTDAVAFRIECGAVTEWVQLVQTNYSEGGGVFVNIGRGVADCASADFLTPDQWTSSGANALYVTGLAVAPDSTPTVTAVCVDCAGAEAGPVTPAAPIWVFCDSSNDGQVTFFADLFKQFSNTAAAGFPNFTGPDPGIEVDTQGDSPAVPDQQVTFFADLFACFGATAAGGGDVWTGEDCPAGPQQLYEPGTWEPPPASPCSCEGGCGVDQGPMRNVYLFSGEVYEEVEDLRIKGRGFDFVWARKYRSRVGPDTAMGYSWDFSYNIRVVAEQADDDIILHDGNSRRDRYELQPDGTWTRREFFRVLGQYPDQSYTLTFSDTGKWHFNPLDGSPAEGKISTSVDRNGNTQSFAYDGVGRLITVTDTLDRNVTIAYNADGFIESVTDFAGRSCTYIYYDGVKPGGNLGDLKSGTTPPVLNTPDFPIPPGHEYPNGKTTVYTYSTGFVDERLNHNLLTITDPKGQTFLVNQYGEDPYAPGFDRVLRQIWGDPGDILDVAYVPFPAEQDAVMKTIVNDRVGNVSEYLYDAGNRRVVQRDYTGRADPDQFTTETQNRPTGKLRPDDPDVFVTRYEWNEHSKLTRLDFPKGNSRISVYESELNPAAPQRSLGNLREVHHLPGPLGGDQMEIIEFFEYQAGFGGCCDSNFVTRRVDGRGNATLHTYDANGNRLHTTHRIPSIAEDWEWNEFGQMTAHTLPDNGAPGGHRRRDEYTYYDSGPQRGYRHQEIIGVPECALTTTYQYDLVGNITRETDPRGHDTQSVYNQLDQTVREISREVVSGGGVRYQRDLHYDPNDNAVREDVQNINDAGAGQENTHFTTVYEYDILNYITRRCAEAGDYTGQIPGTQQVPLCTPLPESEFITTEYEYDANRNRALIRYGEATNGNQPTNILRYLYDERDLAFRQTLADADPDQSTTQYDYDENRNLTRTREGVEDLVDGPHITVDVYDGYDRRTTRTDAMGNVTTYQYDPNDNVVHERKDGELIDLEGGVGNVRLFEIDIVYDDMDRKIRTEVAFFNTETQAPLPGAQQIGKAITTTQYNDNSQVTRVIDDHGHEYVTIYDTCNRRSSVTDAKGNTVSNAYDDNSNVTSKTEVEKSDLLNPDEVFVTTYAYDNLDRRTLVIDNVQNTTVYGYDSRDNRTVVTDALNHETRYEYDGIDRLTRTIRDLDDDGADGDGPDITTTQAWDDTSRRTGRTDDNPNTTTYQYDALNRLTSMTYADGTSHIDTYDVHDNKLTTTDANGTLVINAYDLLDRLSQRDILPAPGVFDDTTMETYGYDGLSRLVAVMDNDSRVQRSYDSLSRMTSETLTIERTQPDETVGTIIAEYDAVGNLTMCTYPGGRSITRTYDEIERLKMITDTTGPPATIAQYNYIGPGRVERREYGNGTRTDYTYDGITGIPNPAGDFGVKKIIRTTHTAPGAGCTTDGDCPSGQSCVAGVCTSSSLAYTWDQMYNKTRRADVRAGGPELTHDYAYDDIYRLIRTIVTDAGQVPIRDTAYDLDGVGNRTVVTGDPDPGPYFMNPTLPEPADLQMNQYTATSFDGRGYDRNGNLRFLEDKPGLQKQVTYDYRNQMVQYFDTVTGQRHTYAYDALGRRIARVVDAGGVAGGPTETRYFYNGWQVVEEQDELGATRATYVYGLYIDEVLQMQRGEMDYYYHTDDLYNVMAVTDGAGNVAERYEYQDYGQPADPTTDAPIANPQSAIGNPYRFTGRRFDPEIGWHYYRTRYLDSRAGRFTTRDTIGIWEDRRNLGNGYTYVASNPWTYADPSGRKNIHKEAKTCNSGRKLYFKLVKCSSGRRKNLKKRACDAYDANRSARSAIHGGSATTLSRMVTWFSTGSSLSSNNQDKIHKVVDEVYWGLRDSPSPRIHIECEKQSPLGCTKTTNAFVPWATNNVHVCPNFFTTGGKSRGGILYHEFTHGEAGTKDKAYVWEAKYSSLSTSDLIKNADTYEEWAKAYYWPSPLN